MFCFEKERVGDCLVCLQRLTVSLLVAKHGTFAHGWPSCELASCESFLKVVHVLGPVDLGFGRTFGHRSWQECLLDGNRIVRATLLSNRIDPWYTRRWVPGLFFNHIFFKLVIDLCLRLVLMLVVYWRLVVGGMAHCLDRL